uniref:Sulfotransferase n=1 Tax=Arundo donax TaxID=35708 RepID=A0A0A9ABA5_ARUDO
MSSSSIRTFPPQAEQETNQELYQQYATSVSSLPNSKGLSHLQLFRHDQGWYGSRMCIAGAMFSDACFAARPSDIVIATLPKSGTTWIKSLLYTIVHRGEHRVDAADHPFNSVSPHECIKFLEYQVYTGNKIPDLDKLPDPRLFATHVPFVALPVAVVTSGCKIVYVCRDPKDTMISLWHFVKKLRVMEGLEPLSVETAAELFCNGMSAFGPYWDHVLGYWRAHLAHPEQVLFFRYEEMWRDPAAHVRRLAEFVGLPFSVEEEDGGVVDAIVRLCSFERMSGLQVTKGGKTEFVVGAVENSSFFRRGGVGDWANHLSPETARRIDAITEDKFKDSGINV